MKGSVIFHRKLKRTRGRSIAEVLLISHVSLQIEEPYRRKNDRMINNAINVPARSPMRFRSSRT
jgi:hypothetical protein